MTRRGRIVAGLATIGVLILALQLWRPAPKECDDGPCSGWEWDLVIEWARQDSNLDLTDYESAALTD
ncbi:MAG: hypothetical protein V7607_3024 [Solirubrobacteraceae bacterium]